METLTLQELTDNAQRFELKRKDLLKVIRDQETQCRDMQAVQRERGKEEKEF